MINEEYRKANHRKEQLVIKTSFAGMVVATVWLLFFTESGMDVGFQWCALWIVSWIFFYWLLSNYD